MSLDKNYQGTDVNLETSLEEYGFVARPITVDYADEYFVIYKMDDNQYGSGHIRESELDAIVKGTEWASEEDVNSMLETVGASKEEWFDLSFVNKFSDLVSYWGTENIMGTDYYPNDKNWAFEEIGLESDSDNNDNEEEEEKVYTYKVLSELNKLKEDGFKTISLNGFSENIGYVIGLNLDDSDIEKVDENSYITLYKKGGQLEEQEDKELLDDLRRYIYEHRHTKGITAEIIDKTKKGFKVKQIDEYGWGNEKKKTPRTTTAFYTEKEFSDLFKIKWLKDGYSDGGGVERLVGSFYYDTRKDKTFRVISVDGTDRNGNKRKDGVINIGIQYYDKNKQPIGSIESIDKDTFDYYVSMGAWGEYKQSYFKDGGKINDWKNAKIGDSARVLSENKMGLIIKDYGRKFHLKFVNGSEKTYDASELEFYKFEEEFAKGGGVGEDVSKSLYVEEFYGADGEILGYTIRDKFNPTGKYTLSSKKERAEENRKYLIDNPSRLAYYRKNEYSKGGGVGEKVYNEQFGIGKSKYVVNYYDGVEKHKDGSAFFKIAIFKNITDKNKFINNLKSKGYNMKYAKGGMLGTDARLEYVTDAYASDSLQEELKEKLGIETDSLGDNYVISFAYTDYGGDFMDKVAIAYFKENYPDNTLVETAGYNGENAYVFGEPAKEWIETTQDYPLGFEDIEDFYYEKQSEQENEDFNYFLDEIKSDYSFDKDEALEWLGENRGGYFGMTTQGLDFSYKDLTSELVSEGVIKPNEEDEDEFAKGGMVKVLDEVKENGIITENQINLIKKRLNSGKDDSELDNLVEYINDNSPKLSNEQNKKGYEFLMNLWKSPTGKERKNSPFGYREESVLENFEYFELAGFYTIYGIGSIPVYNVIGKSSNTSFSGAFKYYYDGKVNIIGADGGMFAKGGGVGYYNGMTKEDIISKSVVYDNPETFDRYTVFTPDGSVFGMSENASGFNQYVGEDSEIQKGKHLGRKLKSVPTGIEWAILDRMKEEYADGGGVEERYILKDVEEDETTEFSAEELKEYIADWNNSMETDYEDWKDFNKGEEYYKITPLSRNKKSSKVQETYILKDVEEDETTEFSEEELKEYIADWNNSMETDYEDWKDFNKGEEYYKITPLSRNKKSSKVQETYILKDVEEDETTEFSAEELKEYIADWNNSMETDYEDWKDFNKGEEYYKITPISKHAKGGGVDAIKVGAKLGLLNPKNGRYKYSIIEDIKEEKVFLVEKHPTRSQWDNHWETTKSNITRFLNEDNEDFKNKKSYVLKLAKGGGVGNVSYEKIYEVLKENIDESIDDLGRTYENSSDFTGEEIEHKFRDGFIPYTNGGYELSWYEYVSTLNSTGYTLPTEKLQAEMQRHVDYSYELAKDNFKDTYPEIVEVVGEDNIDYNSLDEAGFTDEAQELSDWEMEYLSDEDTIRCSIIAYYYEPTNEKGQDGKHTISLQGDINLEAPYHRKGKNDDFTEVIFTFDSMEELKSKLEDGLKNVIDWFNGSKPTGSDDTFAKGGGVKKRSLMSVAHLVDWKGEGIKKWYIRSFPTDDLGEEMNDTNTFEDLWNSIQNKENVYDIIGVGDSVIRERLFEYLSLIYDVDYSSVYDKWLESADDSFAKGGEIEKMSDSEVEAEFENLVKMEIVASDIDEDNYEEALNSSISEKRAYLIKNEREYAKGGGVGNTARTYDGINALRSYQKNEIEDIQEYIADNGTIIEFVSMNDRDSSSGMTFAVTINGRGIYANPYREDAMEFYKDEIAKYKNNYKYANGGGVGEYFKKFENDFSSTRKGGVKNYSVDIDLENGEQLRGGDLDFKDGNDALFLYERIKKKGEYQNEKIEDIQLIANFKNGDYESVDIPRYADGGGVESKAEKLANMIREDYQNGVVVKVYNDYGDNADFSISAPFEYSFSKEMAKDINKKYFNGEGTISGGGNEHYLDVNFDLDKFAKGGGVDDADWIEESLIDLQNEVDMDDLVVENSNNNHYTASNGDAEFEVFETEDDARERAIERVKEDLEENPEYFSKDWLMNYIDGEDFFTEVYNEWNESYANDIESENSDEYANRLIEEMVENGIVSNEEAKEDDFDAEDYKEDFVKLMTSNQIEEGNDGLDYYVSNFGQEQAFKVVSDNNLINIDEASESAIDTDGIGHFLSSYDGEQIDLSNGHVAYRTN